MIIIPAIDLKDGKCVRLEQGRKTDVTVYESDPVATAQNFADAGAEVIHVVDLDGAFGDHSTNRRVLKEIIDSVDVDVQFGGGIRTLVDVERVKDMGVERIVLGTMAAESPDKLVELVSRFGKFIAVGIDAREGRVMTRGWQRQGAQNAQELAKEVASLGVNRIIYTDISRDGMLTGPNIEQTIGVARAANVSVTASGGVSSLEDLRRIAATGEPLIDSVIVGKAIYECRFKLEDAFQLFQVTTSN